MGFACSLINLKNKQRSFAQHSPLHKHAAARTRTPKTQNTSAGAAVGDPLAHVAAELTRPEYSTDHFRMYCALL
jgi:hypothetical protein